jgi:hypothetical protein
LIRQSTVTKQEAEGEQQRQRIKRANEGNSAFEFPANMRIDAEAAMKLIAPYGISLGVRQLLRPARGDRDRRQDHSANCR